MTNIIYECNFYSTIKYYWIGIKTLVYFWFIIKCKKMYIHLHAGLGINNIYGNPHWNENFFWLVGSICVWLTMLIYNALLWLNMLLCCTRITIVLNVQSTFGMLWDQYGFSSVERSPQIYLSVNQLHLLFIDNCSKF